MEVPSLNQASSSALKDNVATTVIKKPSIITHKGKKSLPKGAAYGTGRRKNAIARVWIKPGKGSVTVNTRDVTKYFAREVYQGAIIQPLIDTKTNGQYDIVCTVKGGGTTGQAEAIRHGVARALDCISEDYHTILRKNGFLTRDPRVVERKKYGKRKARKTAQFSKR